MPLPEAVVPPPVRAPGASLPVYLQSTYRWAYLDRRLLPLLDRSWVVSAILWGNAHRLMKAAVDEFQAGQQVMQAAAVYGPFSRMLASRVGAGGLLDVVDVAPLQVANVRRKCRGLAQVRSRVQDLTLPSPRRYGGVCCFFLLHEVPIVERAAVVRNLLDAVEPGGKVVFVDYHQPRAWHPLAPVMSLIFRRFEPFAKSLLGQDISAIGGERDDFHWTSRHFFGALYQIVVATRSR